MADDFFLKFGSDADAFSRDLARDLGQGVGQINELTEALLRYDEAVGHVRNAKNPLGNVFTNLDQASAKLERIGGDLSGQFEKIINSVGQLSTELKEALEVVTNARLQVGRGNSTRQPADRNAHGFTAEQQRILDAQRRGAARAGAVTDADIEAAASGRGKSPSQVVQARTMEQLNRDAIEARNSLRTVANASATVARNSRDASQGLKDLGQSIRTLTTQTKATTHGVTEGRFQQNTIVVQGNGGVSVGAGTPVAIDELLSRAGVVAEQGPVRDAAHQAERERLAERESERRNARALFDLNQPAVPGSYFINGDEKQRLSVSHRINPGETVAEYQQRVVSNSRDLDRIRQQVRLGSEARVGTQEATQLGTIQNLIGRKGLEELLADPKLRLLQHTPGAVNAEQVRASVNSVLAPGKALTPAQYAKVGEALADFQKRIEEFNARTEQYIRGKLSENPLESFTVGGRGDGGDVFGRNQDFYRVLGQYDKEHETQGAEVRAQQAAEQAQRVADAKLRTSGFAGLTGNQREQLRQEAERQAAKGRETFINPEEAAQQDRLAREAIEQARRQSESNRNLDERLRETIGSVNDLTAVTTEEAAQRRAGAASGGGGGGGRKPPKAPSSNPEPDRNGDDDEGAGPGRGAPARSRRSRARINDQTISPAANEATLRALQDSTRAVLEEARRLLPGATGQERRDILARAGAAFQQDPLYGSLPNAETRKRSFRDLLDLDPRGSYAEVNRALGRGGDSEQLRGINSLGRGPDSGSGSANEAARLARYEEILATSSGRVREALLAEFKAQERLNELRSSGRATALQLADATRQLEAATRTRQGVQQATGPRSFQQQLFGQQGFAQNQLRHIGLGIENVIGYSLVFTGFEKAKELAHNGLEAQAAFVRLQATLDANGVSAGNLQTHLQGIASNTATPLENVIEAAAELAGVFNNTGDLEFGTKIAAQLSNISQGTLTTKEAAIGLRDVIDAYGITGRASIQAVGDEIAHLSQITGVSVKDITEGTTQIAQEAREFGLSQHQASTLAAYVSRGTGESGEQSASQTSRLLSSLYNSRAQRQLISAGVATSQQFQSGDIAGVLQNLIEKYKDLAPAQRQAIAGLIGTGIQARAFSAIVNIGSQGLAEFNGQSSDMGALQRQNTRVLETIAGEVKQLDEDFQSLGSNLQRIGAFDFIGGLAKSLDLLLKLVNATFGRVADLANASPLTRIFLHATTVILEARAALLLFGGTLTGFLNRRYPSAAAFQPTNAAAVAARQEAIAGGSNLPPVAPIYNRPTLRGAARGGIRGIGTGFAGLANGGAYLQGARTLARQSEIQQRLRTEAGIRQNASGRFIGANGGFVSNARVAAIARQAENEARILGTNRLTRFGAGLQSEGASSRALAFGRVAERSGQALTGLGAAAGGLGTSARGAIAGIGGFNLALLGVIGVAALVTASLADARRRAKATASIHDEILGNNEAKDPSEGNTPIGRTQAALNTTRRTGLLQAFLSTERHGPSVFNGNDGPSDKSVTDELQLVRDSQARLRAAYATNDPTKIAQAQQGIDAEIKSQAERISKEGGNNKENQAEILASIQLLQDGIRQSADNRIKMLQGLQQVDILTQQQAVALTTLIQSAQGLTGEGIASNPNAIRTLFDQSGLNQNSRAGRQSLQALGIGIDSAGQAHSTNSTLRQRLQGQLGALNTDITQQATDLTNPGEIARLGGLQGDSYKALQQSLAQNIQTRAQIAQQLLDNQAQAGEGGASGLEAVGNFSGAVSSMQAANQVLQVRLAQLDQSDPQYWAVFKQIQDNKTTLANLLSENANNALNLQASLTSDPLAKAQLALKAAQNVLGHTPVVRQADLTTRPDDPAQADRGASAGRLGRDNRNANSAIVNTPARTAAQIQANENSLTVSQTQEALAEAQVAARNAGVRNQAAVAQLALNETLRQEGVYAQGALRDDTKLASLHAQEAQNRIAIADAYHADAQAVFGARAALDQLHGNAVGSAAEEVAKAWADYGYQAAQYGAGSAQAQQAISSAYSAQQALIAAQLDRLNSGLDLQIARSTTRGDLVGVSQETYQKAQNALRSYLANSGQTGTAAYNKLLADAETASKALSDARLEQLNAGLDLQIAQLNARGKLGDDNRAAALATRKARNALAQYTRRGGRAGTVEYDKLTADLATAQRTQFDTALNAQLDTLDFQRETYRITSAQEIASLQQILKNKQLTLAEQRSITLKIKDLQNSIREQLTQGGLNIPSDIKLPTAYEVRRSLGAGFGGSASTSVVNNNQRTSVVIQQTLPTTALAKAVANQVIGIIDRSSGQALRANTTTPRLVPTR